MDKIHEIGLNIRTARKSRGFTQSDLARMLGQSPSSITMYETGRREPGRDVLEAMADIFNVSYNSLVGNEDNQNGFSIPLIGSIACGTPILAIENIEDHISIPLFVNADFALRCKGDSMINARIYDGDIVCIRRQDDVDNGQIAAVLIGEEATLKRVYHNADGTITLQAENKQYPPRTVGKDSAEEVRVLGLATHFISKVV